jgi:hypothetical protein
MTVRNQNLIQEEIKRRLNSEGHRLRVFENRALRRIFGRKRDAVRRLEKAA